MRGLACFWAMAAVVVDLRIGPTGFWSFPSTFVMVSASETCDNSLDLSQQPGCNDEPPGGKGGGTQGGHKVRGKRTGKRRLKMNGAQGRQFGGRKPPGQGEDGVNMNTRQWQEEEDVPAFMLEDVGSNGKDALSPDPDQKEHRRRSPAHLEDDEAPASGHILAQFRKALLLANVGNLDRAVSQLRKTSGSMRNVSPADQGYIYRKLGIVIMQRADVEQAHKRRFKLYEESYEALKRSFDLLPDQTTQDYMALNCYSILDSCQIDTETGIAVLDRLTSLTGLVTAQNLVALNTAAERLQREIASVKIGNTERANAQGRLGLVTLRKAEAAPTWSDNVAEMFWDAYFFLRNFYTSCPDENVNALMRLALHRSIHWDKRAPKSWVEYAHGFILGLREGKWGFTTSSLPVYQREHTRLTSGSQSVGSTTKLDTPICHLEASFDKPTQCQSAYRAATDMGLVLIGVADEADLASVLAAESMVWEKGPPELANQSRGLENNMPSAYAGHSVTYIHKTLPDLAPKLMGRLDDVLGWVDSQFRWGVRRHLDISIRSAESIRFKNHQEGEGTPKLHTGDFSLITIVLMLSKKEDYEGGEFQMHHDVPGDGIAWSHKLDQYEAIIWRGHYPYRITPVISGERHVLLLELWAYPENKSNKVGRPMPAALDASNPFSLTHCANLNLIDPESFRTQYYCAMTRKHWEQEIRATTDFKNILARHPPNAVGSEFHLSFAVVLMYRWEKSSYKSMEFLEWGLDAFEYAHTIERERGMGMMSNEYGMIQNEVQNTSVSLIKFGPHEQMIWPDFIGTLQSLRSWMRDWLHENTTQALNGKPSLVPFHKEWPFMATYNSDDPVMIEQFPGERRPRGKRVKRRRKTGSQPYAKDTKRIA